MPSDEVFAVALIRSNFEAALSAARSRPSDGDVEAKTEPEPAVQVQEQVQPGRRVRCGAAVRSVTRRAT